MTAMMTVMSGTSVMVMPFVLFMTVMSLSVMPDVCFSLDVFVMS
jgi:hypothetical protein